MKVPARVTVVEVGPRDGLQSEPEIIPTDVKVELVRRLVDAGIRRVEVASFVNPKRVPQMADAEAVLAGLPKVPGVQYVGLVLNKKGFDRALAAGCTEVGLVTAATKRLINSSLVAVGRTSGSLCKPSRGPTSTISIARAI